MPLPAITRLVLDGVDEERVDARVRRGRASSATTSRAARGITSPPSRATARSFVSRRRLGRDDDRPHACLARRPRDALRHVPGARREDAAGDRLRARGADGVERAAELERADRLQALELQPELARRLRRVQPDERRLEHRVADPLPRGADIVSEIGHSFARFVSSVRTRHSSG